MASMMLSDGVRTCTHRVGRNRVDISRPSYRVCSWRQHRHNAVATGAAPKAATVPTVADTKKRFLELYKKPIPAVYTTVIQELLVQQHFMRFNNKYEYNEVFALGFVSVYDQILEGFLAGETEVIFKAYLEALEEDPKRFRTDAEKLEKLAKEVGTPSGLTPDENGTDLQKALFKVKTRADAGNFNYNKFFAIGLFRLLELTGAKDPKALETLVKSVGVRPEAVNKDLMLYKGILSKLSAAKELMREFLDRERRKQAERDAAKTSKTPSGDGATVQA